MAPDHSRVGEHSIEGKNTDNFSQSATKDKDRNDVSGNDSVPVGQDKQSDKEQAFIPDNPDDMTVHEKEPVEESGNSSESGNGGTDSPVSPAPLSISQAVKKIKQFITPPERPLVHNNTLIYCIHDFTADGIEEICLLGIKSEESEKAGIEFLSDYSRLFSDKKEAFTFYLYIFSISEGTLKLLKKIELGEHAVYKSMTKFSLYKGKSNPVAIAVHFYTQEGFMQKWLVFNPPQINPLSQTLLLDSFSCKAFVEDIDNDGWIDIVLFERGMEEGLGYETYITWKKWIKNTFLDYKAINIVRNLNSFLFHIKELGLSGDVAKLISFSFDQEEVQKFRDKGLTDMQIVHTFFGLTQYFGTDDIMDFNMLNSIHEIIFPDILDNPFYIRDNRGFYVKLSFRISYTDGTSLISEVLIYMLKNPFGERQFVLYPVTINGDGS